MATHKATEKRTGRMIATVPACGADASPATTVASFSARRDEVDCDACLDLPIRHHELQRLDHGTEVYVGRVVKTDPRPGLHG